MVNNFRLRSLLLLISIAQLKPFAIQASVNNIESVPKAIEDRITSLERIFNSQAQLILQLQEQNLADQQDINILRGQIQKNSYLLNQIINHQKLINRKINNLNNVNNTDAKERLGIIQPNIKNTNNNHFNIMSVHETNATDNANIIYNNAINLIIKEKKYNQAISILQDWVKKYPNSIYQPNANYWIGQLLYNKGEKNAAAQYFAMVAKNYPKSSKASEALLKVGIIMQEKKDLVNAKAIYKQLIKNFPNTDAAKNAKKNLEHDILIMIGN